jgi:hypothetical protein
MYAKLLTIHLTQPNPVHPSLQALREIRIDNGTSRATRTPGVTRILHPATLHILTYAPSTRTRTSRNTPHRTRRRTPTTITCLSPSPSQKYY